MDERRDPWRSDLAALDERTRLHAPSLERTVSLVLASATPTHNRKEKTMSLFKRRPALAALIVLAAVAALTPVAYAVANQILLSIDPTRSDDQIAEDVRQQLVAAGVEGAQVRADREQNRLLLDIESGEEAGLNLAIDVRGDGGPEGRPVRVRMDVRSDLTPAQRAALNRTATDPELLRLYHERTDGQSDADVAAAVRSFLVGRGYPDATVEIRGDEIGLTIVTAPAATPR